jgi:hypothetical protein
LLSVVKGLVDFSSERMGDARKSNEAFGMSVIFCMGSNELVDLGTLLIDLLMDDFELLFRTCEARARCLCFQ